MPILTICKLICSILCLDVVKAGRGNSPEWSYTGAHSPDKWHEEYPHCAGRKQSPIDIVKENVILNQRLEKLKLIGYGQTLVKPVLRNNGHAVQVDIKRDLFIEGGGLPSRFRAEQFHFHWGDADRRGSEHTVDGKAFPMEMHIVHYSTDYANISEALNKPDGLAVLAVFFQIGKDPHPGFEHIVSHFDQTMYKDQELEIEDLTLASLLPPEMETYYRYSGSLTTPPCYESVVWTLYPSYVLVSEEQVNKFRDFLMSNAVDGNKEVRLVNDYRPQQSINVRLVETNSKNGLTGEASRSCATGAFLVLCAVFSLTY